MISGKIKKRERKRINEYKIGTFLSDQSISVQNFSSSEIDIDVFQIIFTIGYNYVKSSSIFECKPPQIAFFWIFVLAHLKCRTLYV